MGEDAQVPIEPVEQTRRLDACLQQPGVLLAGLPGGQCIFVNMVVIRCCVIKYWLLIIVTTYTAGGYDALFCLTLGETSKKNLEQYWSNSYDQWQICALPTTEDGHGLRVETDLSPYAPFLATNKDVICWFVSICLDLVVIIESNDFYIYYKDWLKSQSFRSSQLKIGFVQKRYTEIYNKLSMTNAQKSNGPLRAAAK